MNKIYPDSQVEIQGFTAKKYDTIMNVMSLGLYAKFIRSAIANMQIRKDDRILDLGCGTGRNVCLMRQYMDGDGYILGLDISDEMGDQFKENCASYENVAFKNQRIDLPLHMEQPFDKAFISFVLHGFPHDVRRQVIRNIYNNLKPGGIFFLLDFAEFSLQEMPFYYRIPFETIECKYAFDFIERDWKAIFSEAGFGDFEEQFWFKHYVRLLSARKQ